jgi:hypothetical protein
LTAFNDFLLGQWSLERAEALPKLKMDLAALRAGVYTITISRAEGVAIRQILKQ